MPDAPLRMDDLLRWMPGLIRERLRLGANTTLNPTGDYVLYWMHSTLRLDESPALDAACYLEGKLEKPLLLAITVLTDDPAQTRRTLQFVMGGVMDVHARAEKLGIPCRILCGTAQDVTRKFARLAGRAAAIVTDETASGGLLSIIPQLERKIPAPFFHMDSDALLPRRELERLAFADYADFLVKTSIHRGSEFGRPWRQLVDPARQRPEPADLPPGDLVPDSRFSIGAWVQGLGLDPTIPALPGQNGGYSEGMRRWNAIRRDVLRPDDDQSHRFAEMVPYLRHGMVAPMRLVFDLVLEPTPAVQGFLEKTLLFREYAQICASRQPLFGSSHSLPTWVRQALANLEPAAKAPTPLALDRGETADPVWNGLQHRLRRTGTLPGEPLVFWARTQVPWQREPARALEEITTLYQRFAVGGDDPWVVLHLMRALGHEGRPGKITPGYGPLPPREDLPAPLQGTSGPWRKRATRARSVAVIGAGISGLACARHLVDNGFEVRLFEQAPGPGGRACTHAGFDMGAPFITVNDPVFRRYALTWVQEGILAKWQSKVYVHDKTAGLQLSKDPLVPVGGIGQLAERLAKDLDVAYACTISGLQRVAGGWRLVDGQRQDRGFHDFVVCTLPPAAARMIGGANLLPPDVTSRVSFVPVWTVGLEFPVSLELDYTAIAISESAVRYAFCDSSKPGQATLPERWTVHSAPEWAVRNSRISPEQAAQKLAHDFLALFNRTKIHAVHTHGKFWPRAMTARPLGRPFVMTPEGIVFCGDWCLGRRVEDAFVSGLSAAAAICMAQTDQGMG